MRKLSTADSRRTDATASALHVFATRGYQSTSVAAVATHAQISTAYAFKLFGSKEEMFVQALDLCFERIVDTLRHAAPVAPDETDETDAATILDRMGLAYARLIADRDLLMLQVHAQSAAADSERIRSALQRGLQSVVECAAEVSGGSDADVQRFMAYGQLCHLVVTADVAPDQGPWARLLTEGLRHPDRD